MHSDPATTFSGRMSDGRTAASVPVRVEFGTAALHIDAPGTAERIDWPYNTLTSAEPIRKKSTDVLLSSSAMPGATLFVDDAVFTQSLRERAGQLSTGALRWQYAKPGLAVTAGIALVIAAVWLFDLTPARTIAGMLPDAARVRVGQQVVQAMTKDYAVCHTDEGRAALDKLTARLSNATGSKDKFNVVVVNWDLLNAFATPGSQIVLTRELIGDAKSPDEVAGVLAHEMGHGLELHPETGLVRAIGISAALELMSGGQTGTLANIGALLAQLSYTRSAEREADNQALRILKGAAISPKGLGDFFQRISKIDGDSDDKKEEPKKDESGEAQDETSATKERDFTSYFNTDLLRTHPQSRERAELIRAQAAYDASPSLSESDWKALRDICKNAKNKSGEKKPETPKP